MLPPLQKCISCCLSHQNPATYLFRAVLVCKRCLICADFSPDSDQTTFHWRKCVLWIMDSYFSHVDYLWIIVMFLSAVWTLILTAPIHCRASIAETVMQCYISPNLMKKQTHLHLGWPEDERIFNFEWTTPLIICKIQWKITIFCSDLITERQTSKRKHGYLMCITMVYRNRFHWELDQ